MKETKLTRKTREIVYKNLDAIYKASKKIASDWDSKTIPLTTFKIIVDKSRPSANTGAKEVDAFNINYSNKLVKFYESCEGIAKNMHSKVIPVEIIGQGIDVIKKAFKDGQQTEINNS